MNPDVEAIDLGDIVIRVDLEAVEEDGKLVALFDAVKDVPVFQFLQVLVKGQVELTVVEGLDFIHFATEVRIFAILAINIALHSQ